jgi:hypothetical protein
MRRGFLTGLFAIALAALLAWPALAHVARLPSPELLRYMAAIGATLLIAYGIETSAAVRVTTPGRDPAEELWIGVVVGSGAAGLLGIIVSLALAERAEVGHWAWADDLAFAFAASSLLFLGLFVVLLPVFRYEERRRSARQSPGETD